jgi:hypothetical protein
MGGKGGGMSQEYQDAMASNSTALTQLAQQQGANSQKLFNESNPGFESAESFYTALSSGDPYAISRAIAPATEQVNQATAGAKQNILQSDPNGGEKNLALEQADVKQGSEIGKLGAGAYTGSFNALASLAGQGTGEGIASAGAATGAFSASNQGFQGIQQDLLTQQQNQTQAKGNVLGAVSSLGGAGMIAAGSKSPSPARDVSDPDASSAVFGGSDPVSGPSAMQLPTDNSAVSTITNSSPAPPAYSGTGAANQDTSASDYDWKGFADTMGVQYNG